MCSVCVCVCVCEGAGRREGVWTGSGAWLQGVRATCARRTAEDLGPQPSVTGIQGDVPSPCRCQEGRRDLPPEGISASGAPFLIWCFASLPPTAAGCQHPPPSPHLHPPRSLGASDQFWCSGGSGVTPCGGRQDPSVSPTLCPLKAASRCPWRHRVKKSWPQQRPGIGVPGGRAQLLPARHTCTHSMAKGAGGAKPWVRVPLTQGAGPTPGLDSGAPGQGQRGQATSGTHT